MSHGVLNGLRWSSFLAFLGVYLSVSLIGAGITICFILSVWCFISSPKERFFFLNHPLFYPLVFLVMTMLLSIVVAPSYPFQKPLEKIFYLLALLGITRMFYQCPSSYRQIEKYSSWLAIFLGVVALSQGLGVLETAPTFLHQHVKALPGSDRFFLATGFTFHHTPFAASMIWLFHLNLAQLLVRTKQSNRLTPSLALVFCLGAVLMSFSRGSWLALALSTGFVLLLVLKTRGFLTLLGCAILITLFLIPDSTFKTRLKSLDLSQNQERLFLWQKSIEMFKDRPILGHGYHSYGSVIQKYLSSEESKLSFPRDSHNMYLDMLSGTGIVGTIAFIYFLWSCIRLIWKLFSKGFWSDEIQIWILASWGGLTAFLVGGLFDRHFYMSQTLVPFLFFLGGIGAISMREVSAKTAKDFPPDPN